VETAAKLIRTWFHGQIFTLYRTIGSPFQNEKKSSLNMLCGCRRIQ